GPVVPGPPAATTTLIAQPPSPGQPCEVKVRAHVRASARGERRVLIAQARIRIRRPAVVVSDDHRKFVVRDQLEQPAVGMRLQIGASEYLTGAGGLVELPAPAPSGSPLRVQGISAGRVPDGKV
ncbi:MAG TPA: hypothetical protein VEY30_12740, partial [Myxococcaceae bacterium]|nr:hypothetical protein [Myxococcaceae bacterium]